MQYTRPSEKMSGEDILLDNEKPLSESKEQQIGVAPNNADLMSDMTGYEGLQNHPWLVQSKLQKSASISKKVLQAKQAKQPVLPPSAANFHLNPISKRSMSNLTKK